MIHDFNETENCIYCKKTYIEIVGSDGYMKANCIGKEGLKQIEEDALLIAKVIRLLRGNNAL
jgi:hypothetical protein